MQFLLALVDIATRLVIVPKPARLSALRAELTLLNHNLPAEICVPLWCHATLENPSHHRVVRIPPQDAVVLNSADRVSIFFGKCCRIIGLVVKLNGKLIRVLSNVHFIGTLFTASRGAGDGHECRGDSRATQGSWR